MPNTPKLNITRKFPAQGHDARERVAHALLDEVVAINPDAPRQPSLKYTSAVTYNILHLMRGVGGFAVQEPSEEQQEKLKKKKLPFRAFRNPDIASRARRPLLDSLLEEGEAITKRTVRPVFINTAHYPDQTTLSKLRDNYKKQANQFIDADTNIRDLLHEAAGEVTAYNGHKLSREQRIALYLYREVDGNFTVRTNNGLMLREEIVHSLQSMLKVPYLLMRKTLVAHHDTPDFLKGILAHSRAAQTAKRDADEETPYERAQRRLNYLWNDREMQARIDKVFCEAGIFPTSSSDAIEQLRGLGLTLGGIRDLQHCGIWERSRINGHYSRALAELNWAIIAGFPDGAPDYFKEVVLPYHIAQVARVNSFDKDYEVVQRYGFEFDPLKTTTDDGKEKTIHRLKPMAKGAASFTP